MHGVGCLVEGLLFNICRRCGCCYLPFGIVLVNKSSCKIQKARKGEHSALCLLFYLTFIRTTIIATAATIATTMAFISRRSLNFAGKLQWQKQEKANSTEQKHQANAKAESKNKQ